VFDVEKLALRRDTIVTLLAILVIAIALPFAIVDTFEQGRVYIFSRQFLEELPQRFTGPGRLRFILQPVTAILLGVRGGLRDAETENPPYLFGLLFGAEHRRELLQSGVAAMRNLVALGIIMDIVFQLIIYHSVHPGCGLGRRSDSHWPTLRSLPSPNNTREASDGKEISNAGFCGTGTAAEGKRDEILAEASCHL
jgi:hypothetical protein